MVSVMIISVVISALLQMRSNSTHIFSTLSNKLNIQQYASFLISHPDYGFEKKSLSLDKLLSEFKMEDDLRKELKKSKVKISFEELKNIDMRQSKESSSNMIFKTGKTVLKFKDSSVLLLRLNTQ